MVEHLIAGEIQTLAQGRDGGPIIAPVEEPRSLTDDWDLKTGRSEWLHPHASTPSCSVELGLHQNWAGSAWQAKKKMSILGVIWVRSNGLIRAPATVSPGSPPAEAADSKSTPVTRVSSRPSSYIQAVPCASL
jgi:hypothetical protein